MLYDRLSPVELLDECPKDALLIDAGKAVGRQALTQAHGVDDLSARILAGRGVDAAAATQYLNPTLRDLMPDPSSLQDMDAAVRRPLHEVPQRHKPRRPPHHILRRLRVCPDGQQPAESDPNEPA